MNISKTKKNAIDVEEVIYDDNKTPALIQLASEKRVYLVDAPFHNITMRNVGKSSRKMFSTMKIFKNNKSKRMFGRPTRHSSDHKYPPDLTDEKSIAGWTPLLNIKRMSIRPNIHSS